MGAQCLDSATKQKFNFIYFPIADKLKLQEELKALNAQGR